MKVEGAVLAHTCWYFMSDVEVDVDVHVALYVFLMDMNGRGGCMVCISSLLL